MGRAMKTLHGPPPFAQIRIRPGAGAPRGGRPGRGRAGAAGAVRGAERLRRRGGGGRRTRPRGERERTVTAPWATPV
ncbi:LSU ribosomal protein L15p (L27Ae), mitochondrial [Streptomyces misionensis JCM 4497]